MSCDEKVTNRDENILTLGIFFCPKGGNNISQSHVGRLAHILVTIIENLD